eukprot:8470759-Alexandrium_andersonii.AAC.1
MRPGMEYLRRLADAVPVSDLPSQAAGATSYGSGSLLCHPPSRMGSVHGPRSPGPSVRAPMQADRAASGH